MQFCRQVVLLFRVKVDYVYDVSYGKMDLRNLESDAIYVRNNSTNDLYINAHHLIEATIDYIGNIYYRGDTAKIVQKINGSGKLIHIN